MNPQSVVERAILFDYDDMFITMYIFQQKSAANNRKKYTIDVMLECGSICARLIFKDICGFWRRAGHTDREICHYLAYGDWSGIKFTTAEKQWHCIDTTNTYMYYGQISDEMYVSYPAGLIGKIMDQFEESRSRIY